MKVDISLWLQGAEAMNLEPQKCVAWKWVSWDGIPTPIFEPLLQLQSTGYQPFCIQDLENKVAWGCNSWLTNSFIHCILRSWMGRSWIWSRKLDIWKSNSLISCRRWKRSAAHCCSIAPLWCLVPRTVVALDMIHAIKEHSQTQAKMSLAKSKYDVVPNLASQLLAFSINGESHLPVIIFLVLFRLSRPRLFYVAIEGASRRSRHR